MRIQKKLEDRKSALAYRKKSARQLRRASSRFMRHRDTSRVYPLPSREKPTVISMPSKSAKLTTTRFGEDVFTLSPTFNADPAPSYVLVKDAARVKKKYCRNRKIANHPPKTLIIFLMGVEFNIEHFRRTKLLKFSKLVTIADFAYHFIYNKSLLDAIPEDLRVD